MAGVRIFISHTSDMAAYPDREASFVRAAIDAVNRAQLVPVDMAFFAARDSQPAAFCQEQVRACEVYVAVVGFRYGSIVPDASVSYTELEFQTATEAGLTRLVFLLDESLDLPPTVMDTDRSRIDAFRARLSDAGLILRRFSTVDRLGFELFHALTELDPNNAGAAARDTLPAEQIVFVGRDRELERITAAVTGTTERGGAVTIHAIDGMPGIGKTALAVRAAHRLADRFPDRRFFVDLYGHTPGHEPTDPADALATLLRADGLDPRQLPDGLQARSALWRDRMHGKRTLLVLDNARSTAQVRPLLPGTGDALVLITSRVRLADLREATHLDLHLLTPDNAVAMFLRLAPRAATESDTVAELAEVCGFLPLAIAITASRFTGRPTWTITDLLVELRASGRVLTVRGEDATVRAAFDLSYRHLPPDRQRFFRLLGLHPGVDIDTFAAAALTDTTFDDAAEHLDELYDDHLLDEPVQRRYRMHDLIRAYTHTLATTIEAPDVRDEAVERLLDYYQHTAGHADRLIAHHTRPAATTTPAPAFSPDLSCWDTAADWLRVERTNMLACLRHTTTRHQHHRVVGLTAGLANLLRAEGPWTVAADLHQHAAAHAARVGDRLGHANAVTDLAAMRWLTGHYPAADALLRQSLGIYRELDDRLGQAHTLTELGIVRRLTSADYPGADDLLRQALDLHRTLGNQLGQAYALTQLGILRWRTGNYPGATDVLEQALDIYRGLDHRLGQANALYGLGAVRRLMGDYPGAEHLLSQALDLHRALGNQLGQVNTVHRLGSVRRLVGDYPGADTLLRQALNIYRELGDRLGEASALTDLGIVRWTTGDYPDADTLLGQALDIYRELDHPHGQAYTRGHLAVVRYLTGDYVAGEHLLTPALTALRDVGALDDEVEALNHLGVLRRLAGHPDHARALHHQALTVARHHGYRREEARALEGIGRATADLGDPTAAATHLQQALHLYRELGAPEAAQTATDLAAVEQRTRPCDPPRDKDSGARAG
ncbi:tetratricopeptide repeat protein [Micromonospora sp. NPDC051196]|uniref:tetratricopeptide repeat protein n=1 Tax=Micromonospora sp. NPDC051196 TaxID=3155281 RepID=UPI00342589C9